MCIRDSVSGADAEVSAAARQVRGVRTGDQSLGRNTAVVHAGAADKLAFDDGDRLAGGSESSGQRRARLAGTDDDGVESLWHRSPRPG